MVDFSVGFIIIDIPIHFTSSSVYVVVVGPDASSLLEVNKQAKN